MHCLLCSKDLRLFHIQVEAKLGGLQMKSLFFSFFFFKYQGWPATLSKFKNFGPDSAFEFDTSVIEIKKEKKKNKADQVTR